MLEGAWPLLSGVAQSPVCQADIAVVEALCEVYQQSLLSAKRAAAPLLPTLIASALTIFKVRPSARGLWHMQLQQRAFEISGNSRVSPRFFRIPLFRRYRVELAFSADHKNTCACACTPLSGHVHSPPFLQSNVPPPTTTLSCHHHTWPRVQVSPHPAVCDVLGTAVEVFGELRSVPDAAAAQRCALSETAAAALSALHAAAAGGSAGLDASAELSRALFCMADRHLVFARDMLLACPALHGLLAGVALVLRGRDRDAVSQVGGGYAWGRRSAGAGRFVVHVVRSAV